jgi:hypothetical protein
MCVDQKMTIFKTDSYLLLCHSWLNLVLMENKIWLKRFHVNDFDSKKYEAINMTWVQLWNLHFHAQKFIFQLLPWYPIFTLHIHANKLLSITNRSYQWCSFFVAGRSEPKGVGDPCAGCNKPILDKFLLNVLERGWHASCVRCCECLTPLTEKCFSREAKLYCRNDFFRYVTYLFFVLEF